MKKAIKLSIVVLGMLMVTGCMEPEVNLTKDADRTPVIQNTTYTQALRNANSMISIFHGKRVFIYVSPIVNRTSKAGKVPPDLSVVVKGSFNKIGEFVSIVDDPNRTIQTGKSRFFKIDGAVTQYDTVETSGSGMRGSAEATYHQQQAVGDFGSNSGSKSVELTLSFNPVDVATGLLVPRTSTSNQIRVDKKDSSNEFAFSILGSGIGINNALSKSHGIDSSLKILVELSVVEALGKLTNYPYWLLTGGKMNPDVVDVLSRKFLRNSIQGKIEKISYLLSINDSSIKTTKMINPALKQAIIRYKTSHGMPANDIIDKKLYMSLLGAS